MKNALSRRRLMLTLLLSKLAQPTLAQTRGKLPIRLLVAFPTGGVTDIAARAVAQPMSGLLGTPIVVENHPGGDGIVAADMVAKAPSDGSLLLAASATALSYAPAARKRLPFDASKDFASVGRVGEFGFFLYSSNELPVHNLQELREYAKSSADALNHANASATALLTSDVFAKAQGIRLVQVQYKGDAQVAPDLVTGRVQLAFAGGAHLPLARSGALRVLLTTLPRRSRLLPDVPTWAESGLAALSFAPWFGFVGPAHIAPATRESLTDAMARAVQLPEVLQSLDNLAFQVRYARPADFDVFLQTQLRAWTSAARAAGVQPQ